jgi:hypothetical protein
MMATIKIFQVGLKRYKHVKNTRHDSVELRDECDDMLQCDGMLLNFDAGARVTNHEGRMGDFYIENVDGQARWVYYELPLQTRTVFGPDLPTAELEVSKRYLGKLSSIGS